MRKSFLYLAVGFLVSTATLFYGCKKVNGVDNNQVIETPYSLFFADTAGALYKSNDGLTYEKTFPADGYPSRALITSGNNLLWAKANLYYSNNNGLNFNQSYDSLQYSTNLATWFGHAKNGFPIDLNESMIIDVPGPPDLVYACSDALHNLLLSSADYLGLAYNDQHGEIGHWSTDNAYDTVPGKMGVLPVQMVSLALLPSGALIGLALNPTYIDGSIDELHFRNFYNPAPASYLTPWEEATGSAGTGLILGGSSDTSGSALPPNAAYPNDTPFFTLGVYNNRLIAIDEKGFDGAWYCDDGFGRTWVQFSGLPANVPLLCVAAPFNQVCMIGTQGAGLYYNSVNTEGVWQQNLNGLTNNLVIRGIVAKQNIYKNNSTVQYVYIATNKGIYQSKDMGLHWSLTIAGNYVSIY
jgi:hypothetical protein